jgi:AraC-like DNA-binding protein
MLNYRFTDSDITVPFQQVGEADTFADGWVHRKTVPYAIIAQPIRGWYTVSRNGRTVEVHPGQSALVPANTTVTFTHHGTEANPISVQWLHISCLLFGAVDITSHLDVPLVVRGEPSTMFGSVIQRLLTLTNEQSINAALLRKELGLSALRTICDCSTVSEGSDRLMLQTERLRPLFRYMNEHLREDLTIGDLATVACLSPSRLYALFKTIAAVSPMNHLRGLRIAQASRMLLMSDQPISRVAADCGFINQFHFSRIFKQSTGLSPTEYRRKTF